MVPPCVEGDNYCFAKWAILLQLMGPVTGALSWHPVLLSPVLCPHLHGSPTQLRVALHYPIRTPRTVSRYTNIILYWAFQTLDTTVIIIRDLRSLHRGTCGAYVALVARRVSEVSLLFSLLETKNLGNENYLYLYYICSFSMVSHICWYVSSRPRGRLQLCLIPKFSPALHIATRQLMLHARDVAEVREDVHNYTQCHNDTKYELLLSALLYCIKIYTPSYYLHTLCQTIKFL